MRLKCNSILRGLALLVILSLSGCFPEGDAGCPEDLLLSFDLDDQYEDGNYDTRIANDVYLYVFQDQQFAKSYIIPYEEISGLKEYVIKEKDGLEGNLDYVAWAVARDAGDDETLPAWSGAGSMDDVAIDLDFSRGQDGKYLPLSVAHYSGVVSSYDKIDEVTRHTIPLGVSSCRIEVNITDASASVLGVANRAFVQVNGTMSQMTMRKTGTGQEAEVVAELKARDEDEVYWSTGRFGVLPSSEGQQVSVDIYTDGTLVETLVVPADNLPRGAEAGGLLVFDYVVGEGHFYLSIDGFIEKIVIIDEM